MLATEALILGIRYAKVLGSIPTLANTFFAFIIGFLFPTKESFTGRSELCHILRAFHYYLAGKGPSKIPYAWIFYQV